MGSIFVAASAVLVPSRVNRRCRRGRPDTVCTPFGSLRSRSGKSESINSYILTEIAASTRDVDPTSGTVKQRPRIVNLLEEVDSQVSGAEAHNLELEPSAPDAALSCNQQNMEEDVLSSKETWMGTTLDSLDANKPSDSDSDISDGSSDINDIGSATFTRLWTEPPGPRGCSGFVRQRTAELNSRDLAPLFPLFPLLSKHLDIGSGDDSSPRVISSNPEGSHVGKPGFVRKATMELEKVERAKQSRSQQVRQLHLSSQ